MSLFQSHRKLTSGNLAQVSLQNKIGGSPAGFTLIELLTVIAIISVLSSLIFVVVQKQMETARSAQCQSNLKQMGVAIFLFAAENQGALPNNTKEDVWPSQIWPYAAPDTEPPATISSTEIPPEYVGTIFACPEAGANDVTRIRDYAFNYRVGDYDPSANPPKPSRLLSLIKPAEHALVTDAKNGSWLSASIFAPRHSNMVNVLYADGHVGQTELTEEITRNYNGVFWGRSSQAHRW